ncbi:MAG TPA: carboxypeptidase regulatory-like domain-containing protein [Candidatus Acidoferrales bacterium]
MTANTGSASIAGHIFRSDNGVPLGGATVSLLPKPTQGALSLANQQTAVAASDGAYAFQSLVAGDYFVQAESSGFVTAGHRGAVSVAAGESVDNANIRLDLAGSISGGVYNQEGDPLEDMKVTLFYTSFADHPEARYRSVGGSDAVTDDQGNFRIRGMRPGKCYVVASTVDALGPYKADLTYYPNASSAGGATLVQIKPGEETTGIRITLPQSLGSVASPATSNGASGSISGHVYRADSGAPLAGAVVFLNAIPNMSDVRNRSQFWPAPAVVARSDANGVYKFQSLAPGKYVVSAQRQGFIQTYLSLRGFIRQYPQIEVSKKPVTNVDGRLRTSGVIAGTVTDPSGRPIPGMMVSIVRRTTWLETGKFARLDSVRTDEDGRYRALLPAPADYYVTAGQPPPGFRTPASFYARAYYPHAASPAEAQTIHVDPAAPAAVDLQLTPITVPTYTVTVKIVAGKKDADQYHTVWFEEGGDDVHAFLPGLNLSVLPTQYAAPGEVIQFRGVHPGRFTVGVGNATIERGENGNITSILGGEPNRATATVEVANADVTVEVAAPR